MTEDHRDPLQILASTKSPEVAAWAMNELAKASFADVEGIARDFGWHVKEDTDAVA